MPEYQRSISIKVEIDTNKATYNEEFEETYKAVEFLFNRLADEQRLEIMSNYFDILSKLKHWRFWF